MEYNNGNAEAHVRSYSTGSRFHALERIRTFQRTKNFVCHFAWWYLRLQAAVTGD